MQGKRKWSLTVVISALCFSLCGCGENALTSDAMACIQRMEYQEALEKLAQADEAGESERLILRGMGIAYLGMGDLENAVSYFEQCLGVSNGKVQSMDYDVSYYLAAAYSKQKEYSKAKTVYDAILTLRPKEKDAYYYRGVVSMELGDYQGAVEDFDAVISLDPDNYDRVIDIYQIMEEHGYKEAGKEFLQDALSRGEGKMSVFDSGRIFFYLEEYQKAYIALEEAKSKGGAEAYLYLGKAYEATGDFNYATSVYSSYLSKEGANAAIYNQLGTCEMKKKEYQKALDAFLAGLQQNDASMHQSLAFHEIIAYEYLGKFEKAKALLQEYLEKYPEDEAANREMTFLSTR